jgi:3-phenylpropionate/cinnamic acid dioxygenase small subunit
MPSITEARDEILQLLYRYNHLFDSGDADGWADLFIDDGVLEGAGIVMSGRPALVEFAASVTGLRHVVVNPVVEVSDDSATVHASLLVYHGTNLFMAGSYEDDVVRTSEGWRFVKRVFTPDA